MSFGPVALADLGQLADARSRTLSATRRWCAVRRSELKEVEDLLVGLSQQPYRS